MQSRELELSQYVEDVKSFRLEDLTEEDYQKLLKIAESNFKSTYNHYEITDEDLETVDAMFTLGGYFIRSLAQCFKSANGQDFSKLKAAFSTYWEEYKRKSKLLN